MCKEMTNKEVDNSLFIGQDIDFNCVQMCALNLLFFNLNGAIIFGNTLAVEVNRVFITKRSYSMGGSLFEDKDTDKWKLFIENNLNK